MKIDVKFTAVGTLTPCSRIWMAYFLVTIAFVGLVLAYGLCMPLWILGHWFPKRRKTADFILCKGIYWLMRMQPWLVTKNDLKIPYDRGSLLVSNHRSHLDTFLLLSEIKGIRVLAKSTLFRIPFLGLIMRASGQIATERGRVDSFWSAMDTIRKRILLGDPVHVFPEMTRCAPEQKGTKTFMIAPFLIAKETNTPVIPIAILGTDRVWPKGTFALRPYAKISVRSLEPLDPSQFHSAQELRDEAQRRINEALL